MKRFTHLIIYGAGLLAGLTTQVFPLPLPEVSKNLSINGAFLGGYSFISQSNEFPSNLRRQFDYAVNLDFTYQISPEAQIFVQLQGSPGGSAFGFPGPSPEITDVFLQYAPASWVTVTAGSFDTPFGQQTEFLSNNADVSNNPLVLNSLFYSAFSRGPMGTLNTVGVMGEFSGDRETFSVAVTNGTDESATNPDGGVNLVFQATTNRLWKPLNLGISYMSSNDSVTGGSSGNGSDFQAYLVDFIWDATDQLKFKGYAGGATFGDNTASTYDFVAVYMGEAQYTWNQWIFSASGSAWVPNSNTGGSPSSVMPNPGLAITQNSVAVSVGQAVLRYQLGIGYDLSQNFGIRTVGFYDDYRGLSSGNNTDTMGGMIFFTGVF